MDSPSPSEVDHARQLMNEVGTKVLKTQELDGSKWDLEGSENQVRIESRPAGLFHNLYLDADYREDQDGSQNFQARLRSGRAEFGYIFEATTEKKPTWSSVRVFRPRESR